MLKTIDERGEEVFLVLTMAAMVALIAFQSVSRYLLGNSLAWGTELAIYLHIWQIWLGASLGIKKQEHIRVDVFVKLFPPKIKMVLDLIALLVWFGFALFLAIQGTIFINSISGSGQTSPTLDIAMWIPYIAIPLAGVLMAIRLIQQMYGIVKNGPDIKEVN
ncbi:TRAP transporter small permease [Alteribacillus iranensis]|uniref:TRAP-type C4-dicarboxylate transport system, small permease component n=1 Tax=Alteribacillus iranensis TaxID=930128 RepID=A0A1I2BLZ4_9BACI|nr:TRAP transporter small permease [Alteribacillus iranensis]SFE56828.1 TRAP-type C4-dicarboxylate transport system, small permease component [Alteribacillus iranensis]